LSRRFIVSGLTSMPNKGATLASVRTKATESVRDLPIVDNNIILLRS
jgi:hypothetical protein